MAEAMRQHISSLYSTDQVRTSPEDVFLFQGGMSAISQVVVGLQALAKEKVRWQRQRQRQQQAYRVAVFGSVSLNHERC